MKVKDLAVLLAAADQELDIAVLTEDHEYWGKIYGEATFAGAGRAQIDGPKRPDQPCFLIVA